MPIPPVAGFVSRSDLQSLMHGIRHVSAAAWEAYTRSLRHPEVSRAGACVCVQTAYLLEIR